MIAFLCFVVAHLEWPDMRSIVGRRHRSLDRMAWFRILCANERSSVSPRRHRFAASTVWMRLSPAEGLRAMAAFYRDHRPQHAPAEDGGDVLEVRWGPGGGGVTSLPSCGG